MKKITFLLLSLVFISSCERKLDGLRLCSLEAGLYTTTYPSNSLDHRLRQDNLLELRLNKNGEYHLILTSPALQSIAKKNSFILYEEAVLEKKYFSGQYRLAGKNISFSTDRPRCLRKVHLHHKQLYYLSHPMKFSE